MKKMNKNYKADNGDVIAVLGCADDDVDITFDLECQLERERKSAADFPEFYRLEEVMNSSGGYAYRSGESEGMRYMTNDDYCRIILERTRIPQYVKGAAAPEKITPRPAAPYNVLGCGRAMVGTGFAASVCENVFDGEGYGVARVERSTTNLVGALISAIERWMPAHMLQKQDRAYRRRYASSAAGIAWVMIFALVIALPITLGVLKSEAVSELNARKEELYALEKTEAELRAEFESSLDLRRIEHVAMNEIGMIKLNDSTIKVLRLNDIDTIESFTDKKSNSVVPALLSALGIRAADE